MGDHDAMILVVEDDDATRRFLAENLTADGYEAIEAGDGGSAIRQLSSHVPDLAIVDLGLPDGDGLELLDVVRASDRAVSRIDPGLPIVVLSGRASELERIRGLTRGADDYVAKPFSYFELRARIDAVLRRSGHRPGAARMKLGPLEIDSVSRQAWLERKPLPLTGKEFGLLRTLASEPFRAYTREELLRIVWGYRSPGLTRTVDTHVSRLRRKLGEPGAAFIVSVWGVGYRLLEGRADESQ